ncbi:thiosulfate oxidation carrier complex protein SoxZ [Thiohalomonas denitrificans]|uniref:Sulfur-oxidizing protein SoxZ n=1 Tax=Thiohalomonas denitrificans TaxID=415747 RepID=A0A1G5PZX8_9GAMM|nr:thiosulfate oxidation carrier complex protein SoxZ [Thiohalomonas denitrificans]SCZ54952.1 sulfur-oxidizing protein SoxZ [Thiohalomonas denitrificans]
MSKTIKIRAQQKGDICQVKALIKHPMETGLRKDKKTGKKIPAHFIQEVNCAHEGEKVLTGLWGGAVSTNPYLAFEFEGAKKGDKVTLSWADNQGESDSVETTIR